MASGSTPTTVTTVKSKDIASGNTNHNGHDISNVGPVSVKRRAGHAGGTFHVWYCQNDDTLFMTITD